jgi:hypothetical protein
MGEPEGVDIRLIARAHSLIRRSIRSAPLCSPVPHRRAVFIKLVQLTAVIEGQ